VQESGNNRNVIPKLGELRGCKIAIVAMGKSATSFVQHASSKGGIHGVADFVIAINAMGGVIRHDLLIAMDDLRVQEERVRAAEAGETAPAPALQGTMKFLLNYNRPWLTSRAWDEYPEAQEMPMAEIFTDLQTAYMNNTVAWALAWAICHKPSVIQIWGADFSYPDRHGAEAGRGCVEYLLGIAHARDIMVQLPAETSLMDSNVPDDHKPYGYDSEHIEIDWDTNPVTVKRTPRDKIPTGLEMAERYRRA
jgi:hypothetical protein